MTQSNSRSGIAVPAEIEGEGNTNEGDRFQEHEELFSNMNFPDIVAPDDLPIPPDEQDARNAANEGSVEGNTGEPQGLSDLEARLQRLEAEREQERQRYEERLQSQQSTIDRLIQGVAPQQAANQMTAGQQQQVAEEYDLPDPVEKPKEFAKAMADLVRRSTQQATQQATQTQTREQQLAQVRTKFWTDNADLSDVPELVDAAYQREALRLQAAGIDPTNAALSDPDGLSARVAEAARERARQLGVNLGQGQQQQAPASAQTPAQPARSNRTAGVSAGSMPSVQKSGKGDTGPGLVEELKRMQRDSGFF